jgi:hypothetical protein
MAEVLNLWVMSVVPVQHSVIADLLGGLPPRTFGRAASMTNAVDDKAEFKLSRQYGAVYFKERFLNSTERVHTVPKVPALLRHPIRASITPGSMT